MKNYTLDRETLLLRPPNEGDEGACRAAHRVMRREDFDFLLGNLESESSWSLYLRRLREESVGVNLATDRVPATFLVAEVEGQLVGRSSIRHTVNDWLMLEGGHIGYCVLPGFRRNGYASEILRQSLIIARSLGVTRALLICDEANLGSRNVIERCGGILDSVSRSEAGRPLRRYYLQ